MSKFALTINTAQFAGQIDSAVKNYHGVVKRATSMGINRTIKHAESVAVKLIAAETGYKQKRVRENLKVYKSTQATLSAYVEAARGTYAINLIEFVRKNRRTTQFFRKRYKSNSKRRGYSKGQFKYKGVEADAWNTSKTYRGTFIGRNGKGQLRVFKRTGGNRSRPTLVSAPSIPATFKWDNVQKQIEAAARKRFSVEFDRAARYLLSKTK